MRDKIATVNIDSIGAQGDGIGHYEGKPVYVAKTAPGDAARVELDSLSGDSYGGKLVSVETPGPGRVPAPCPYFQKCGGCALQHLNEQSYRAWKISVVEKALERADIECGAWEPAAFLPAATRRRATMAALKVNGKVSGKIKTKILLGYNEARTHNIIDAEKCLVLEPALDEKFQGLRVYLPRLLPEGKIVDIMLQHIDGRFDMVLSGAYQEEKGKFSLQQHEAMMELSEKLDIARISFRAKDFGPVEILFARRDVIKRFGALSVRLPPASFLQASAAGEDALIAAVVKYAGDAKNIADLFCGAGTFTGSLLKPGVSLHAADFDSGAILALEGAAKTHDNLKVSRRDLFKNPFKTAELKDFDAIIFDPPRAGAKEQTQEFGALTAAKIIAVSCNPASFARDVKILQDNGYKLRSITPVDQFVYAAHVEIVALFTK